jgi:hypothetical protein
MPQEAVEQGSGKGEGRVPKSISMKNQDPFPIQIHKLMLMSDVEPLFLKKAKHPIVVVSGDAQDVAMIGGILRHGIPKELSIGWFPTRILHPVIEQIAMEYEADVVRGTVSHQFGDIVF